jgi:protein-S-isoprenylcysteine O-methyltransferase Ste14
MTVNGETIDRGTPNDSGGGQSHESADGRRSRIKGIVSSLIYAAVMAGLLFVPAGTLDWPMAWILLGVFFVTSLVHTLVVSPGLIEERSRRHDDSKRWDRSLAAVVALIGLAVMVVAGLDHRFGWTGPLPLALTVAALVVVILGSALLLWATTANAFFSATIRIQRDRGHVVVSDGPYRYVRHPGYAGWTLYILALPLALGSIPALVPAVIAVALYVLRTALEDATLRAELAGYQDYADRVRYRLVPGVW